MAIIKLGTTVVGIRGTLGGNTFSANKSGPYVKSWAKGANPQVPLQQSQRSALSRMPALWRALTPAEQASWDTWAALPAQDRTNSLGETFSASGFNWFTIINTRLLNMGRATRTAVPVIARPAAPTISTMQLPFLPQQTAYVTYPSGEFNPNFDIVIEIQVANSIGQQVQGQAFKQLYLAQDVFDTDAGFIIPYLERFNIAGDTYKGFAKMYRQTEDGVRSAAGTLSFISSDTPAFAPSADDYNGTTVFGLRGADMSGATDARRFTVSLWFRIDAGDGTSRFILTNSTLRYALFLNTSNELNLQLSNSVPTIILNAKSDTPFTAGAAWHHFIMSVDLTAGTVVLAVDGIVETPNITTGPTDDDIDFTAPDHSIGADTAGTLLYDGCLSQVYLSDRDFIDISQPNNLRQFIDEDGAPVFLGNGAQFPTNTQPIMFYPAGDATTNDGFGGASTYAVAPGACSSTP